MTLPEDVTIGPVEPEHLEELARIREQAFLADPASRTHWTEQLADAETRARMLGAFRDGWPIGMLWCLPLGQWFGGRCVPMGGVASVAVRPEHRGRGVVTALLGRALAEMRARGDVLSTLHPATTRPYRNAGWELAGERDVWTVPVADLAHVREGEGRARRAVPDDRPAIERCYERVAARRDGWLRRSPWMWERHLAGDERRHEHVYVVERDDEGDVVAFASFRQVDDQPAPFRYGMQVHDLVALDAPAARTVWRLLAGYGAQVDELVVSGGSWVDLELELREARVGIRYRLPWMTRLVDAAGAIAARGFPRAVRAEVPLTIVDPAAPWNEGERTLVVEHGRGRLEPGGAGAGSGDAARTTVTARALGALYTGHRAARDLVAAGEARGGTEADRDALDAVFAGPRPTTADMF